MRRLIGEWPRPSSWSWTSGRRQWEHCWKTTSSIALWTRLSLASASPCVTAGRRWRRVALLGICCRGLKRTERQGAQRQRSLTRHWFSTLLQLQTRVRMVLSQHRKITQSLGLLTSVRGFPTLRSLAVHQQHPLPALQSLAHHRRSTTRWIFFSSIRGDHLTCSPLSMALQRAPQPMQQDMQNTFIGSTGQSRYTYICRCRLLSGWHMPYSACSSRSRWALSSVVKMTKLHGSRRGRRHQVPTQQPLGRAHQHRLLLWRRHGMTAFSLGC
mmetsp:Transcript_12741/g.22183  ORF Transcript_12741/g.22183 Transcript_12741/m.22183 type:complete len:270 (-) Transcript_12741:487-1296(-)